MGAAQSNQNDIFINQQGASNFSQNDVRFETSAIDPNFMADKSDQGQLIRIDPNLLATSDASSEEFNLEKILVSSQPTVTQDASTRDVSLINTLSDTSDAHMDTIMNNLNNKDTTNQAGGAKKISGTRELYGLSDLSDILNSQDFSSENSMSASF